MDLRERAQWDYVFAALASSSFLDMGRMMHWFTGNIGYHHIHHLNARIPFYRLPETMRAIERLQSPATTSLRVAEIWRCLRLRYWCPERSCMVRDLPAVVTQPSVRDATEAHRPADGERASA